MIQVNRNPDLNTLRSFGLAMLLGFGLLGGLLWYAWPDPNSFAWRSAGGQKLAIGLWAVGTLLALASIGPRGIAVPVYVGWMTIGMFLGGIMTFIMMSALFFVLLPVFSLIRFKNPLRLKLKPPGESYWEDCREHEPTLERTARPF